MPDKNTNLVPAVDRVLNILEYIAAHKEPKSIKEISSACHIPPTSAFRLVKHLLIRGYLRESVKSPGCYKLDIQILTLSGAFERSNDIRGISRVEMDLLAKTTKQTAQLGVLRGNQAMYIEQVLSSNSINIISETFTLLPLNISASGKAIVAQLPTKEVESLLGDIEFKKQTEKTIASKTEFINSLSDVVKNGYALDDEEYAIGIGCLSAPIFNHNNNCIAAVGITGRILDYSDKASQARLAHDVISCAQRISLRLGWSKN